MLSTLLLLALGTDAPAVPAPVDLAAHAAAGEWRQIPAHVAATVDQTDDLAQAQTATAAMGLAELVFPLTAPRTMPGLLPEEGAGVTAFRLGEEGIEGRVSVQGRDASSLKAWCMDEMERALLFPKAILADPDDPSAGWVRGLDTCWVAGADHLLVFDPDQAEPVVMGQRRAQSPLTRALKFEGKQPEQLIPTFEHETPVVVQLTVHKWEEDPVRAGLDRRAYTFRSCYDQAIAAGERPVQTVKLRFTVTKLGMIEDTALVDNDGSGMASFCALHALTRVSFSALPKKKATVEAELRLTGG